MKNERKYRICILWDLTEEVFSVALIQYQYK